MTYKAPTSSPYAIICKEHGQVLLTDPEYDAQMLDADRGWICPICGASAEFDDDHLERFPEEDN